jgi:GTPase
MAKLPTVAIIGRPNTGKSTLFNRIVGKRRAIVSDVAGTTRDHVVYRVENEKLDYLLLDTGGIGGGSTDKDFEDDVSAQSRIALESADLIIFTVDGREDLTASDYAVIDILRKRKKRHVPVILVPTKCDNFDDAELRMHEYLALGITEHILPISAVHRIGTDELEETIVAALQKLHFMKEEKVQSTENETPRVAIIGKPNVGKSSIVNALMSEPQRALSSRIVSDIPGTTRDSSDSIIKFDDREYLFVDTAGLRRKSRVDEDLETISAIKSIQAVEDSDITVLVLDAHDVVSQQDKRIAALAIEEGKGLIMLLNKADLLTPDEKKEKEEEVRIAFRFCRFAPMLFCSAETRDGLLKLFPLLDTVHRNLHRSIPMKDLRRWYDSIVQAVPSQQLNKSKYITQAEGTPPTFVVFVKDPKKVDVSQLRFLDNNMRSTFSFEGAPIRWITK